MQAFKNDTKLKDKFIEQSAARSAADSAAEIARSAEYTKFADKLISLLEEA